MSNTWWKRLWKRNIARGTPKHASRARKMPGRRLLLESLELRLAPATHTWSGAGINNNWSLDSNWTGGSPANDPTPVLVFPAGAAQLSSLNDLNSLAVQSITFSANNYLVSGNPISLMGGITLDGNVSGLVTFNLDTTLAAAQTWTVTKAGANLAAHGDLSGAATANLTLTGAGNYALAGNNTYTGSTTVSSGVLIASGSKPVGLGTLLLNNGSTLEADGAATLTNLYTVTGSVIFNTKDSLSSLTLRGRGTLNSFNSITVSNSPGEVALAGSISGNGSLIVNPGSTGDLTVSGPDNSNLSGPVTVNSGSLTVGSNNALGTGTLHLVGGTLQSNGPFAIGNVFSVEGPAQIGGENNLTLTGPGTLQDGSILSVTNRAQTTLSGSGSVLTGRGALVEDAGDTGVLQLFNGGVNAYKGGTRLNTGTLVVNQNFSLGDGALTLSGGTLQANAAVTLSNPFSVVGPPNVPGTPAIGGSNNITMAGLATLNSGTTLFVTTATNKVVTFLNDLDGPGGLTVAAAGTAILSVANTYTGPTTITAGTLQLAIANGISSASAVTITDGGTLNLNGFNDTIASLTSPLPPFTNATPQVLLGSATLTTGVDNTSTTFAGVISGSGGLTKNGTGTLTLSGTPTSSNTYTGPTVINAGTLVINESQPASTVMVNSGATLRGGGALARTGNIVSTGGIVSPGTATSTTLRSGTLTLDSASTFVTQLLNRNVVDQFSVTGAVNLGNATLNAGLGLGFTPNVGDSFTLISGATSVTGTFQGLPEGAALQIGNAIFTITYAGGTSGHNVVLTRSTLATTTTLTSSDNPSVFSEFVTFTATVTPSTQVASAPTGVVTFRDGNVVLDTVPVNANGQASTRTSALLLGSHTITARYNGDSNFTASVSAPLTQTVNQAASVTTLIAVANPAVFRQPVVLTAKVVAAPPATDTPTGSVVFSDGATVLGTVALNPLTGQATFSTSQFAIGNHSLTVSYSGDSNFTASTSAPL
ncbi:MAG TPA: Ig-like domain repeat protein, partial [Gemmataceae bacterium]|nr:Ig-like domain repeat protein [Gemmataceae bacterium]